MFVIPAKAGIQAIRRNIVGSRMDARFRDAQAGMTGLEFFVRAGWYNTSSPKGRLVCAQG